MKRRFTTTRRRGSTAMMAVIFLTIFSALALGFYSTVTTSVQVAGNERRTSRSMLACDSGMQFMRYHLGTLNIASTTPPDELFNTMYTKLQGKLNNRANMPASAPTIDVVDLGTRIRVPGGANNWIALDNEGSAFRAEIFKKGEKAEVKVWGRFGNTGSTGSTRGVSLEYANDQMPAKIFNFGVASKSAITLNSNARIIGASHKSQGSVLSATLSTNTPVTMSGNASISGDVSLVNPSGRVSTSPNATIDGTNNPADYADNIHVGVEPPDFPTIDTSSFKPFAGNPAYGGVTIGPPPPGGVTTINTAVTRNVYIRANPGTGWVVFDGNTKIEGVIYIETPNKVRFDSNTVITGAIVVQNNPTGTLATNIIEFRSNTKLNSIDLLPDDNPYYPPAMQALTGAAILAPNFYVLFNSNFGSVGGSIIASKMEFDSNAVGTVKGSVINLADSALNFRSNSAITVESQGTNNYPAGVKFGSRFSPLPDTYKEFVVE